MTDGFMLMHKDLPRLQVVFALYTEFSTFVELVEDVLLPNGLARSAASPNEAQACQIGTVMIRAKILPGTVAKGTLGRCTVQDICRKLIDYFALTTPMLQSAHIIATLADAHEVLHTLGIVQMQPVAPPTLQAPVPPSISSATFAQILRFGNNVLQHQKAHNASTGDHWFCWCGIKLSRLVRPSGSTFEQRMACAWRRGALKESGKAKDAYSLMHGGRGPREGTWGTQRAPLKLNGHWWQQMGMLGVGGWGNMAHTGCVGVGVGL